MAYNLTHVFPWVMLHVVYINLSTVGLFSDLLSGLVVWQRWPQWAKLVRNMFLHKEGGIVRNCTRLSDESHAIFIKIFFS